MTALQQLAAKTPASPTTAYARRDIKETETTVIVSSTSIAPNYGHRNLGFFRLRNPESLALKSRI